MQTIELSVTASNYKRDSEIIRLALKEVMDLTHSDYDFDISEPEYTFGWYFFIVTINKSVILKLANLLGNEFLNIKGKTHEIKFVNWLTARLKRFGCNVHIMLKEDFMSSKYGLF